MSSPKINEISDSGDSTGIALILLKNTSQRLNAIYCTDRLKRISGQVQHTYMTKNSISSQHKLLATFSAFSCRETVPIKVCKLIFITSKLVSEFVSVSEENICPLLSCSSSYLGICSKAETFFHSQSLLV